MTDQLILLQLQQLPDHLKQEALDFIGYLLSKNGKTAQKSRTAAPKRPRNGSKKRFSQYRGCLKTGLSVEEIDRQLNQIRDEWERPIG